jgi:hypothetical protein
MIEAGVAALRVFVSEDDIRSNDEAEIVQSVFRAMNSAHFGI